MKATPLNHIERNRLPAERRSVTKKLKVNDLKLYVTVGLYEDGKPGEVFIRGDRVGTLTSGVLDALATVISIALQHGVELKVIADKLAKTRFEPAGVTGDSNYPIVSSVLDYLARWLTDKFCKETQRQVSDG